MAEEGTLRIPTREEQYTIASVVRMVDRLRARNFEVISVILNDEAWGDAGSHWTYIIGLPVIHRETKDWPAIQIGVLAP